MPQLQPFLLSIRSFAEKRTGLYYQLRVDSRILMIILGGSASTELAEKVAKEMGGELGRLELKRFPDGEKYVRVLEDVAGKDVAVVQSLYRTPDEYLFEYFLLVDALRDLGARSITGITPYLAYARQDARFNPGEAVSCSATAKLIEAAGTTSFITVDTHLHRLENVSKVFKIPARNISAMPLLGQYALENLSPRKPVVIGPDAEAEPWAAATAKELDAEHTFFRKKRITSSKVEIDTGEVDLECRDAVFEDDIISTGGTIAEAAGACKKKGARKIYALCTHPVLASGALERLHAAGGGEGIGNGKKTRFVWKGSVGANFAKGLKAQPLKGAGAHSET